MQSFRQIFILTLFFLPLFVKGQPGGEIPDKSIYQYLQSAHEKDWLKAQFLFYEKGNFGVADSLMIAIKKKFPFGEQARNDAALNIYTEKKPEKKEKKFFEWAKKFPPGNFPASLKLYDYTRLEIAKAFIEAEQFSKALSYLQQIQVREVRAEALLEGAAEFEKKKQEKTAVSLFKQARDLAMNYKTLWNKEPEADQIAARLPEASHALARLYFRQNNIAKAYEFSKEAYDQLGGTNPSISMTYARVLIAKDQFQDAFAVIEKVVMEARGNRELKDLLLDLYVRTKGTSGRDDYVKKMNAAIHQLNRKRLAPAMVDWPAPTFSLKDLEGKTISLSDYRGKIVVLDFWATWCIPCKKSFPVMQQLVTKFKNRGDISFLFVHTWEHDENATEKAANYLKENRYDVHVLMDLKDPVTQVNNTILNYGLNAIPAKVVIDAEGRIRFITGDFTGEFEDAVEEIETMIELASEAKGRN